MQYSDTTNRNGILQSIERESKLGLGTISDNSAPDYYHNYFLSKINEWLHIVEFWIQEVNDEQTFDDTNNTGDIPEEYSFTDDTQIYELDSDITKIRKVEFRDAVTEEWYSADYYYQKDRIENLYGQSSSNPTKYFVQGRDLITDIPVDTAKVDKYRITYDRHGHEFVIGDTTAEPGFDKRLHWLLVYGPVMDWSADKDSAIFAKCRDKIFGVGEGDPKALKTMIETHYMKQNRDLIYKVGREDKNYD